MQLDYTNYQLICDMEKLKISNFRKIKDELEIDFAPTTFLTGTNNSGKSTIIKSILIINDYLNSMNLFELDFNGPNSINHKINSFNNAKSLLNSAENSRHICFEVKSNGKIISAKFEKHPTKETFGILNKLKITYDKYPGDFLELINIDNKEFFINKNSENLSSSWYKIDKIQQINSLLKDITSDFFNGDLKNWVDDPLLSEEENIDAELNELEWGKKEIKVEDSYYHAKLLLKIYRLSKRKEFIDDSLRWIQNHPGTNTDRGHNVYHLINDIKVNKNEPFLILHNENSSQDLSSYYKSSSFSFAGNKYLIHKGEIDNIKDYIAILRNLEYHPGDKIIKNILKKLEEIKSSDLRKKIAFLKAELEKHNKDNSSKIKSSDYEKLLNELETLNGEAFKIKIFIEKGKLEYLSHHRDIIKQFKEFKKLHSKKYNKLILGNILNRDTREFPTHYSYILHKTRSADAYKGKLARFRIRNIGDRFGIRRQLRDLSNIDVRYLPPFRYTQKSFYFNSNTSSDDIFTKLVMFYNNYPEEIKNFVEHWMQKFKIGKSIEIEHLNKSDISLGFTVQINRLDDKNENIKDLGYGAGQILTIILCFADIISKQSKSTGYRFSSYGRKREIMLIEEPECNLHPALQSRLSDMFYQISQKYGVKIIAETHSEYMIRKSQIKHKSDYDEYKKIKTKPKGPHRHMFKTWYLTDTNEYYDMKYNNDGTFQEEFGSGFFDESSNLAFDLF